MLLPAKQLTGFTSKRHQEKWLKRHGFRYGKNWWEQRTNGDYVVWLPEQEPPKPQVVLDFTSLGPKEKNSEAPAKERLSQARTVSGPVS